MPTQTLPNVTVELQRQLQLSLGDDAGPLGAAVTHAVSAAGKLVRPRLVLDACLAVGGDPASVIPAAVGTELGHIASLIHDDVMDADDIRRGRPSVHSAFGVPIAILTGDLLVFEMFLSYARSTDVGISADRALAAIRILSQTCIDVCRGQALEAEVAGRLDTTEERYFEVIRLKTASVCRASAEIGAVLGGGSPEQVAALGAYGEAMGTAFQIVDDSLEYASDAATLGKPVDSDARNGRVTLPLIYALRCGALTCDELRNWLRAGASAHPALVRVLLECGALAECDRAALRFTRSAQARLQTLAPSESRERLAAYADALVARAA